MRSLALLLAALFLAACTPPAVRPGDRGAAPSSAERFTWVEGAAGRLRVSDGGLGGVPVLFVHGLGSDLEVWRAQLDHVRPSRRAIAFDQRGHGASDRAGPADEAGYTIDALVDDLERVRAALGLERMVLAGHSMAGPVITTYAGRHRDRVAGLVYVDALGDFAAVPEPVVQELVAREAAARIGTPEIQAEFDGMLGTAARPDTRRKVLDAATRLDPPAFARLRASLFAIRNSRERLGAWRGPALAVEDARAEAPQVLAAHVLGVPRVQLEGVSHWLQLDDPAALNRALDGFLPGVR